LDAGDSWFYTWLESFPVMMLLFWTQLSNCCQFLGGKEKPCHLPNRYAKADFTLKVFSCFVLLL